MKTKAQIKKKVNMEKTLAQKQDKTLEKACTKCQTSIYIWQWAISKCQKVEVVFSRNIFSDTPTATNKLNESVKDNARKTGHQTASLVVKCTLSDRKRI